MFYWLFFEKLFRYYSPFRVFQYSTFRTGMATLTAMPPSIALVAVVFIAPARISDRPAYSGRRAAIAPQESGHPHHGRLAHLRVNHFAHAAVVQPARACRVGGDDGHSTRNWWRSGSVSMGKSDSRWSDLQLRLPVTS